MFSSKCLKKSRIGKPSLWSLLNISLATNGRNFPAVRIPVNERKFSSKTIEDAIKESVKWQQEQEQNNENSWFNEYQEVEDYIIKRIGDKFLEAK